MGDARSRGGALAGRAVAMLRHPGSPGSQCWPRSVPGDRLAGELARCDREIAAMYTQTPVRPAWLTTLGIEDWEAEKRLILEEAKKAAPERKGTPMLLLRLTWWETVENLFDDDEKASLACAVSSETIRPAGVYVDTRRLTPELRDKVEGLLYDARLRALDADRLSRQGWEFGGRCWIHPLLPEFPVGEFNAPGADPFVQAGLGGLRAAVRVIRAWHGESSWVFYYRYAPEMAPIRDVLGPAGEELR
jgi:hypothetical protein